VNAEEIYIEFTKHLETVIRRLDDIEKKMDAQYERDHKHELKLLELENKINSLTEKTTEALASIQANSGGLKQDVDNLAKKIRDLENNPIRKKASFVDKIADRAFEIILAALLGGGIAWIITHFK
jgi:predicted  nucleic acid-binding Zn-ribbon protein